MIGNGSSTSAVEQLGNSLVRVFYRIFPIEKPKWDTLKLRNNSRIYVKKMLPGKKDTVGDFWEFHVDGIFNNCKQSQVYNEVVADLLDKLENGQNAIIVSYGKTGTGKSATTAGLEFSEEDYGIGPRIIKKLLQLKNSFHKNKRMFIKMSYVEFSGNDVYDLFKPYPNRIEDSWKAIQQLLKISVHTELDALRELYAGEGRKDMKTIKNYMSHINSSILTFYVTTKDMEYSEPRQITGKIHLVDLAGSDTIGNLSCISKTKLEISIANMSKSHIEQFFLALCQHSNEMIKIKQRGSPLVCFLGGDIKTQSYLRFIGHITTCKEDYALTISMLRFGQIIRGFTPGIVNLQYEISPEYKLKYLQGKIEELEKERIQNSILLNQDLSLNLNCERIKHLEKTIREYLKDEITEIDVMSVADASVIFKMFKDMLEQKEMDKKSVREGGTKRGQSDVSIYKKTSYTNYSRDRRGSVTKGKRTKSIEKMDKQTSIHSMGTDDKNKAKGMNTRSHDISSSSVIQSGKVPKKTRSKVIASARQSLKRRSMVSVNNSTERMTDQSYLPDNLPDNLDAWNEYAKNSSYNIFSEEYKANEKNILEAHTSYLTDVKKLQAYKDQIGAMKQELLEARILMKFKENTGDVDKYTETILIEAERICKENMENAERSLIEQEEIVLRGLTELKIFMNIRKDLKKKLAEDFDSYCKTKYNIPIPQAKSLSDMEMIRESKYSATAVETQQPGTDKTDVNQLEMLEQEQKEQLTYLKDVMKQERRRSQRSRYFDQPYLIVPLPEHRAPHI